MNLKEDARLRVVERAWEGTRLEGQALAQAYEEIEAASFDALQSRIEDKTPVAPANTATMDSATDPAPGGTFQNGSFQHANAKERRCCLLKEERHVKGHDSCRALCARLIGAAG